MHEKKAESELETIIRIFEEDVERLENEKLKIEETMKRRRESILKYRSMIEEKIRKDRSYEV